MARIECIIRGNGKGYALISQDNLTNADQFLLKITLDNGNSIWGETVWFSDERNSTHGVVIIFPLFNKPFTLSLYINNSKQELIFEKRFTPFELKWESRINYRVKPSIAKKIRDIEGANYLIRRTMHIDMMVPDDNRDVIRGILSIPESNSTATANLVMYDSSLNEIEISPVILSTSALSLGKGASGFVQEILFSFDLPKGSDVYLIESRDPKIGQNAFLCIDDSVRRKYFDIFGYVTKSALDSSCYNEWRDKVKPSIKDLTIQRHYTFEYEPLISIVSPLFNTPKCFLREMVDSVLSQTYSNWELILVNASPDNAELSSEIDSLLNLDERIHVVTLEKNEGITLNTRAGIEASRGEYVSFLDHDDFIEPNALFEYILAMNEDPLIDVLYCDEDKILDDKRFYPYFKPDFSLFLLREVNYICHFLMIRRSLLESIDFSDSKYDGAQDHNMILQCIEKTSHICHVPKVLYTWRVSEKSTAGGIGAKSYADTAGRLAIEDHLRRCGIDAIVESTCDQCRYHVRYAVTGNPLVSILIPNKDNASVLRNCVSSIISKTNYENYEIIIIENNSEAAQTFDIYDELRKVDSRVKIIKWLEEFNYSAINNFGAEQASGEYLLLLNNDTEVISSDWLETMIGICQQPEVGIVGAKLLYPDMLIQHAGVYVQGDAAGHLEVNLPRHARGYFSTVRTTRELSAVTAACMMIERSVFDEVGGLDIEYAIAFNDVDFCMKVRAAGKKVIYSPLVELLHYESISRGYDNTPEKIMRFNREVARLKQNWSDQYVTGDPYMNVNLNPNSNYYGL